MASSFIKIRRASAPRLIAEQLINRINAGELKPGDSLPAQRELARLLGVGRSSIREAINALSVMGYIEVIQGRGTFIQVKVPSLDAGLLKLDSALEAGGLLDLLEIREIIECRSAQLAAERAGSENIQQLKKSLKRMEADSEDYSAFLDADLQFHAGLAQATQNTAIQRVTRLILEEVAAYHRKLKTAHLSPDYRRKSIDSAKEVVSAVEKGDGSQAGEWIWKHLNEIRAELKDIVT
jgi:GntR family transcriptional repressor for pyruvate dehydrogenase complex